MAMEAKALTDLLITYIGWRIRFVASRPRKVIGLPTLNDDNRTAKLRPNIDAFLRQVEQGADLTPYLSLLARKGYTPAAENRSVGGDTWADKDFLLNVMGLHHFHLGLHLESAGHIVRTNEVLFASVTRDEFEILGLADHHAFEHEDTGAMTPERNRLWTMYQERQARDALPGQLVIGGFGNLGIATSGHPVVVTLAAQRHIKIIEDIEPKLDDPSYVRTLYGQRAVPTKPKPKWAYRHLDLGLLDEPAQHFGLLHKGPN